MIANKKLGTIINCNLSLNEQTRLHTSDELASLFDVFYCQIEQLIIKQQPQAKYTFDNETIVILLLNDQNDSSNNIDQTCRLGIELFRFIQHVNQITQWSFTAIIGIDYGEVSILSPDWFEGLATDHARWLREECDIINRIHVSSRVYDALKETKFYEFHSYSWTPNKTYSDNNPTYFMFSSNMYEPLNHFAAPMNNSSMIDQLTRIQAQYHVEKHLGTITLTRSLRKRSLIELTTKHLHWTTLNFKNQFLSNENTLNDDFQVTHRANKPDRFIYLFIISILIASIIQSMSIEHSTSIYLILFPSIIVVLTLLVILFLYSTISEQTSQNLRVSSKNRKFYVYLNVLICLTFCTLFFVAAQYHSIWNFKYLYTSNDIDNQTSSLMPINISSSQNDIIWNIDRNR